MGARVGLSWMDAPDWGAAALPLFEDGAVEVLEWTFDTRDAGRTPEARALLAHYAEQGALLGHAVGYRPFTVAGDEGRATWLRDLERLVAEVPLRWVSEHLGFAGGGPLASNAPLPVPATDEARRLGTERMRTLAAAAGVPVGLENLAFAFSIEDVRAEGAFLEAVLAPVDGFLVLDLHNLWCRACNFELDARELLEGYPLERVREVHVSGGSWATAGPTAERVRRDTHDAAVPEEVFALLDTALARCPSVEAFLLERLGGTLTTASARARFCDDFTRLAARVREHRDAA